MDPETIRDEERSWKRYKLLIRAFGIAVIGAIVIVSILRERIVNHPENRITVHGEGRVEYVPDRATVSLGIQVSKAASAQEALDQLNQKMNAVIDAIKGTGIDEKDIKTDIYSVRPQYSYDNGTSAISGYDASQSLEIKVKDIKRKSSQVSDVIQAASAQGANQVLGVAFDTSDLEAVKQEARIKAIEDAKAKSVDIFKAAEVKTGGKIVGWHEESVQVPGNYSGARSVSYDSLSAVSSGKETASPEVPSGTQEVVIEMGVDYDMN